MPDEHREQNRESRPGSRRSDPSRPRRDGMAVFRPAMSGSQCPSGRAQPWCRWRRRRPPRGPPAVPRRIKASRTGRRPHVHETPGDGAERKAHERGDAASGRPARRRRRPRGCSGSGCAVESEARIVRAIRSRRSPGMQPASAPFQARTRSGRSGRGSRRSLRAPRRLKQHAAEDHAGKDPGDRRSDPGGPFLSSPNLPARRRSGARWRFRRPRC